MTTAQLKNKIYLAKQKKVGKKDSEEQRVTSTSSSAMKSKEQRLLFVDENLSEIKTVTPRNEYE